MAALTILISTLPEVAGCGHATVPCPTPTQELDRLREETERTRAAMDRELALTRALAVKWDAEAGRLIAAEASLDSLGTRERR